MVGAIAVVAIGMLVPSGLGTANPELNALVAEARDQPPGWSEGYGVDEPRRIGGLEIGRVTHRDDGVVTVLDADSGFFFHVSGWAHSPDGPPTFEPGVSSLEVEHLDGDWYAYSYVL